MGLPQAFDEHVGEGHAVDQRLNRQRIKQVGVDFDHGYDLALVVEGRADLGEDSLPHLGEVDLLEVEEVFSHPLYCLDLAAAPPAEEVEDMHLVLQITVDHLEVDLPFADLAIRQQRSLAEELAGVQK